MPKTAAAVIGFALVTGSIGFNTMRYPAVWKMVGSADQARLVTGSIPSAMVPDSASVATTERPAPAALVKETAPPVVVSPVESKETPQATEQAASDSPKATGDATVTPVGVSANTPTTTVSATTEIATPPPTADAAAKTPEAGTPAAGTQAASPPPPETSTAGTAASNTSAGTPSSDAPASGTSASGTSAVATPQAAPVTSPASAATSATSPTPEASAAVDSAAVEEPRKRLVPVLPVAETKDTSNGANLSGDSIRRLPPAGGTGQGNSFANLNVNALPVYPTTKTP